MRSIRGKLIAIEGIDGSGKSTQAYLVKRWLELSGIKVFYTEWDSSLLINQTTRKAKKRKLLSPTTFSLLHATDFADRYERQILPLLKTGYVVLSDRYVYTAYVRDVLSGCDPAWVRRLYNFAVTPDITFYLNMPQKMALQRLLLTREELDLTDASLVMDTSKDPSACFSSYQKKLQEQYKSLIDECQFVVMDAGGEIEELQEKIREIITERIGIEELQRLSR